MKKIVLTADRPTGPLHLGHLVGSIKNRIEFQNDENLTRYLMIADIQAMTDNFDNPQKVFLNIKEVLIDYLACGIDPEKTTIFLQSQIKELAELTMIFMNLVSIDRLFRNPTLKSEIKQKGFICNHGELDKKHSIDGNESSSLKLGFLSYPVSQASDIALFLSDFVPVGGDQLPIIEQTNEIINRFNFIYKTNFLKKAKPIIKSYNNSEFSTRLKGFDGKNKMSKSLNNAIFLKDTNDEIALKIKKAYTDPLHIKISDPGRIENNIVFEYLDVFYDDRDDLERLKNHYMSGGLADSVLKSKLTEILISIIEPIRKKRDEISLQKDFIENIIRDGTKKASIIAQNNFNKIKEIIGFDYKNFFS